MGRKTHTRNVKQQATHKPNKQCHLSNDERELLECVDKLLRITVTPQQNSAGKALENHKETSEVLDKIKTLEFDKDQSRRATDDKRTRNDIWEQFLKWTDRNGAKLNGCAIEEFEGYDLGLKTTKDISQSDVVISVPRKIMLSLETAKKGIFKDLIQRDQILKSMPNVALSILLLVEKFKENSFWKPYLDILPKNYTTVLYFSPEELEELKGSPALELALKQIRSIARQYAYFHQLFHTSDDPVSRLMKNKFTFNEYCWAVSTVMTRQNTIPAEDGSGMINVLIPLWDLCNHTNGVISTDYNTRQDTCECLALRDFKADEQFFIFYGARTNADLFIHNGFVYEENEHDGYWLRLGISKSDPLQEKRSLLLKKLEIPSAGEFFIRKGPRPIDEKLLAFLRIFNMSEGQLQHWLESDRCSDLGFEDCALDTVLEKKTWSFLQARLKLLLSIYKTTLEEDQELLHTSHQLPPNKKLAVRMRSIEKKIINDAIDYVEQRMKQ